MSKKRTPPKKPVKTIGKKTPVKNPVTAAASKRSKDLIARGRKYFALNYKPRDMIMSHGKGARLFDLEGKEYVDFGAGIAVCSLGHANPLLVKTLKNQCDKLWHTSNIFFNEPAVLLAEELVKSSKFARRVFFSNSGGEANEAAIKLARKYAADKGKPPEKRNIITFHGSFHGRTLATVTATAQPKYQHGFEPLPGGFLYCEYNNIDALEKMMNDGVCAVMIEIVQGEGGIIPAAPGYLTKIKALCEKYDALLMLDQVQDGMGRTGHVYSHFAEKGLVPDVVTLAKGLGGGTPIGAMLVGEKASEVFQFGSHGSTYGGSPLATSVAFQVLKTLQSKGFMKQVNARGEFLKEGLRNLNKTYGLFADIRGRGLMIGAELIPEYKGKAGDISELARLHGAIVLQAGPDVLRFVPPLIITERDIKEGLKRLEHALQSFMMKHK